MKRKGIILAGGSGTRLYPITQATNKQLLPVYDKPMIYYPLSVLMLAGIQDILIISTPADTCRFESLLGDGAQWGLSLQYQVQESPDGLAQALILGEDFLANSPSVLILGDNIFYGDQLGRLLRSANARSEGATIFAYRVREPQRYGVIEFDSAGKPIRLLEKPQQPPSDYAITGLYFYDADAPALAKQIKPSARGELEITDLNQLYLDKGLLQAETMGRGFAWLDVGTHEALLQAGQFIAMVEQQQGLKTACLEEIALLRGWIDKDSVESAANRLKNNSYGAYLRQLASAPDTLG